MTEKRDNQLVVRTQTEVARRLERPRLYRVLLHNDDYTPRDFVVLVLQHVFHMGESEAIRLMIYVHTNGVGVAGIFPFSVAETKVAEVTAAAQKAKFPLMCTLEPETGGEDAGGDDASS